jgi:hypothetical protein
MNPRIFLQNLLLPAPAAKVSLRKNFVVYALVVSLLFMSAIGPTAFSGSKVVAASSAPDGPESSQAVAPLLISEFRWRGPNGPSDEFVEIYNNSDAPWTVGSASSAGYALVASDGLVRFIIPNGTVIPARGHYLGANNVGYSLGAQAAPDASYAAEIPDNVGIALFNNSAGGTFFNAQNRLDAVGSVSEANALYKEGTGLPNLTPFSIEYSWTRNQNGGCGAFPRSTGNNAADFVFTDTNGTSAGAGQRLGAPGPQNLASALGSRTGTGGFAGSTVDIGMDRASGANAARNVTPDPAHESTFGTVEIRHKFTNVTGLPISNLRFRIVDISSFPSPFGVADLRPMTSINSNATLSAAAGGQTISVQGTNLPQPPLQPNGGGVNSVFNATGINAANPLPAGSGVNLRFVFGVQQVEKYRVALSVESYPVGSKNLNFVVEGNTDSFTVAEPCSNDAHRADFDGDGRADVSVFRQSIGTWYSLNSNTGFSQFQFGLANDRLVPGDYDGDGVTDFAVFRPSNGTWYIQRSTAGFTYFQFGLSSDLPAQADFDGDGITDYAVFRPSNGTWYFQASGAGFVSVDFGINGDKPVVGDYDGDGKADIAVFRPSNGTWYVQRSLLGFTAIQFGLSTDKVVPADYDGDGKTDVAVFRSSNGTWYQLLSSSGFASTAFGTSFDVPVPGDYDFDGRADVAVFRPGNATWYRLDSSNGFSATPFGQTPDHPVEAGYVPVQ